jgi:hypothetical protein
MKRIEIPIDRGLSIINILSANEVVIKIMAVIIYNNEDCTHSSNIKGLCALYTILYLCSSSINT